MQLCTLAFVLFNLCKLTEAHAEAELFLQCYSGRKWTHIMLKL